MLFQMITLIKMDNTLLYLEVERLMLGVFSLQSLILGIKGGRNPPFRKTAECPLVFRNNLLQDLQLISLLLFCR